MCYVILKHKDGKSQGTVESVLLRIYGTKEMPGVMKKASGHRRAYNFQLRDVIKHKYVSRTTILR